MPTRGVAPEVRELEAASNLNLLVDFDLVASLDVVVALDADTAFHAGTYFGSVILEAAQGFQLAFEDNDVFTQYTDWTVTVHNIFDDVVDDVVVTHVQAFLLDDLASASIGTHVEAEQYSVGSQCQVSVGLGDTTDTATDDTHLHFVVTQAVQGAVQRFEGTTNVRFEDDVERLLLCLAHVLEDVFQLAGVSASQFDFAELALTEQSHFTGFLPVRQHAHLVASVRGTVQAEDLDRDGRTGFLDLLAVLVEHGTYTAVVRTDQHHVALTQGAVLNQNGCNRATTFVETRLNHNTATWGRWRCFQFEYFSLQQDRFEQFVHASTDFRRNRNERRITAPLFRSHAVNRQFATDAIEIGARLVDFVHCHNQWNTSGLGVLDSFNGLRHHAVVRCNHQDHDVSRLGTTGTHCGKRGVTWGVEEGDHAAIGFNVVSADVLGDTAGFASSYLGTTNVVEQRCLTMVNVAHYGHNWRTGERLTFKLQGLGQGIFQGGVADQGHFVAQFFGYQLSSFLIKHLVDGRWSTQFEHELDDFSSLDRHLIGEIANSDGLADLHITHDRAGWALETVGVAFFQLGLAATTTTEAIVFFVGSTWRNAWSRRFLFDRGAMRSVFALAITAATATTIIVGTWFVRTTRFVTLAGVSSRCWCSGNRSGLTHSFYRRSRSSDRFSTSRLRSSRLATRFFFGATLGFFFSLLTSSIIYCATFFQFAFALGFDFFRAALYEDFLLAYFNADALATSNTQGAGGFALQCNLARFFHFRLVAALQVSQQRLLLTIAHTFIGGGVRQTCLTHLLQQALYRCFDLIGQLFHRDLRHALLSSGRA